MDDCVLCRIIAGIEPATILWESGNLLAITPLEEVSPGHAVLMPKEHFRDIFDIADETLADLAIAAKTIAGILIQTYGAGGINLLHASGADAQQSVFHFHLHLVPRFSGDGLDLWIQHKP